MPHTVHLTTLHPRSDVRIVKKEALTLARALGREVVVVVADGLGSTPATPDQVAIVDLGAIGGGRLTRFLKGSARAYAKLRSMRPRIVHFHDPELIPVAMALKLSGAEIVYDVHEDLPRQVLSKHWIPAPLRRPVAWLVDGVERLAVLAIDGFVAATETIGKRFPAARTVVVQNFPIKDELVEAAPVPYAERPATLAYVGGLSLVRGAVEMLAALDIAGRRRDLKLEVAGLFAPPGLAAEVEALPGWRRVDYRGYASREEVAALLGRSRAGLVLLHPIPNYLDSYPVKLFEYMAAGLPAIVSDFPLWRRIVTEAGCGLVVDPKNPDAIAEAMLWILDHPAEAEAMGRRGREAVERVYSWDAEGEKLATFYRSCLRAGDRT